MKTNPRLMWEPVDDAISYEVTLRRNHKLYRIRKTEKPFIEFENLKPGQYFWSVRAIDPPGRKGRPMAMRSFRVDYGKRLRAPEQTGWEIE